MTYILGLTGSIATGKTTVHKVFKDYDFPVIDADQVARIVVEPGTTGLSNIVKVFGEEMIQEDGTLNRKKLGEVIFNDDDARKHLDSLLKSLITEEIYAQKKAYLEKEVPLLVIDIPLLYEGHFDEMMDGVMVVSIPESLQKERLMKRDQLTESQAINRIKSQLSIEIKEKLAEFVIDNSHSLDYTKQQVLVWLKNNKFLS